ncbi:MAG: Sec-independent protein translocase protein TatB [bacterium]
MNLGLGYVEILLILIIALVVVGPRRLPELLRNAGKLMGQLRRASDELRNEILYSDEFRSIQDTIDDTKDNFTPPAVPPRLRTKKKDESGSGKTEQVPPPAGDPQTESEQETNSSLAAPEETSSEPEHSRPSAGEKVEDGGESSDER